MESHPVRELESLRPHRRRRFNEFNAVTYLDRGSSNLPTDWIWNIRSPPPRYSMTKNKWSCQSINQSINQSIHQSINPSIHQSINQPTNQSIYQSIHQSISQSVGQSVSQSINQSVNQSINLSINQSIDPSINQPVTQLLVWTWRHGGNVGGQEQKHFSPLGTKLYFHVNSSRKFYYIEPQHGCLDTWLQTKNWELSVSVSTSLFTFSNA